MNLQQYLQLIQKAVQLKSGADLVLLLPFSNFNSIIPAQILNEIKNLRQVSKRFNNFVRKL